MCLFINKVDLLTDFSCQKEDAARDAYRELIERLTPYMAGIIIDVYVGSAEKDTGVLSLRNKLIETATSID